MTGVERLEGPCALHGLYGCCSWCPPIEVVAQPKSTQQEVLEEMGRAYRAPDPLGQRSFPRLINGA